MTKIYHKFNETVKYYPNRIYSKERLPKFKLKKKKENSNTRKLKNKRRGALSKIENIALHLIERTPPPPPSNNLEKYRAQRIKPFFVDLINF